MTNSKIENPERIMIKDGIKHGFFPYLINRSSMIPILIVISFFAGYFFEVKELQGALVLVAFFFLLDSVYHRRKIRIEPIDFAITLLVTLVLLAEIANPENRSSLDMVKFLAYLVFYFSARLAFQKIEFVKFLELFAWTYLALVVVAATLGYGLKYWGSVETLSLGYHFKTDLALGVLIATALLLAISRSVISKTLAITATFYILLLANSRIGIITLPVMAGATLYLQAMNYKNPGLLRIMTIAVAVLGVLFVVSIDYVSRGQLGFDFNDLFSDRNTQGRNNLWEAIWYGYVNSSAVHQLFGAGLGADQSYSWIHGSELHWGIGSRSHNSFLYVLVSGGIISLILFLYIITLSLRGIICSVKSNDKNVRQIGHLFGLIMIIFLVFSLTVDVIIRAQIMAPLLLTMGATISAYSSCNQSRFYYST